MSTMPKTADFPLHALVQGGATIIAKWLNKEAREARRVARQLADLRKRFKAAVEAARDGDAAAQAALEKLYREEVAPEGVEALFGEVRTRPVSAMRTTY